MNLTLSVLPGKFAICRLGPEAGVPGWASAPAAGGFVSITRTDAELSIVCPEPDVPEAVKCDRGWRCLEADGPLDLSLTGVLAALATPLAGAHINIFAVSTYDTDYLLVKDEQLARAVEALTAAGHRIKPR